MSRGLGDVYKRHAEGYTQGVEDAEEADYDRAYAAAFHAMYREGLIAAPRDPPPPRPEGWPKLEEGVDGPDIYWYGIKSGAWKPLERRTVVNRAPKSQATHSGVVVFYGQSDGMFSIGSGHSAFSNWYHSATNPTYQFKAKSVVFPEEADREYYTAEQYIMAEKIRSFGGLAAVNKKGEPTGNGALLARVMASTSPAVALKAGRSATGHNPKEYAVVRAKIAHAAVYAKFSTNPALKAHLLGTGEAIIAEASKKDKVWGIGIGINETYKRKEDAARFARGEFKALNVDLWPTSTGMKKFGPIVADRAILDKTDNNLAKLWRNSPNLLGRTLMLVRSELRREDAEKGGRVCAG